MRPEQVQANLDYCPDCGRSCLISWLRDYGRCGSCEEQVRQDDTRLIRRLEELQAMRQGGAA